MPNLFQRLGAGVKAAATSLVMSFASHSPWRSTYLGRTRVDYASAVDSRANSIVMACVLWMARTFPEAPLRVRDKASNGEYTPLPDHPLLKLLRRPNKYYSGTLLWMATLMDWMISGNAYWIKIRSGAQEPVELWWVPSGLIEPKWPTTDSTVFIGWYEYKPSGIPIRIDPANVVHFRYGLDPANIRKGLSPLASVLREIFTDDEAANFTSAVLSNMGVPGVIIAPSGDDEIDPEDADQVKNEFAARFGGDRRGQPLVMSTKTDVHVLSWSPSQMDLKALRRIPEERVSAIFGTPAVVVGLGAGLDRSTFANFAEAREAAYESLMIPSQRLLAEELQTQMMDDFSDPDRTEVDFDISQVRVLQPDQNALATRLNAMWLAGRITLNQSLNLQNLEQIGPQGDIYAVPINVTLTPLAELGVAPVPPALPAPSSPTPPKGIGSLLILPEPKVEQKAAPSPFVSSMERLRSNLDTAAQHDVQRFLTAQQGRIVASLHEQKDIAAMLDWDAEDARLTAALRPSYLRALEGTTKVTSGYLSVDIEVPDATVRSFLQTAGGRISDINTTTKRAIQKALAEANAAGEGIDGMTERIQQLTQFSASRAELIAVTENGGAMALATAHAAVLAGIEDLQIHDPDGSDHNFSGCTDRHGKIVSAVEAFNVGLAHPRCKMLLVPVARAPKSQNGQVDAKELVGAI